MREILFRGKCLDNGKWAEGFVVASRENTYSNGFEMITVDGINYDELDNYIPDFTSYAVDPSTIGQYTGLKDKNGKKIFEGDIVRCMTKYGGDIGIVTFKDGKFVIYWQSEYHYPKCRKITDYYYVNARTKIMGNIYDNPELIREEV